MRLSENEVQGIISALQVFINEHASLYLYGSRTKSELKGGDIDLLLISNQTDLKKNKHLLLLGIKNSIGDQKIDLTISDESNAKKDPFLINVSKDAVLLHCWP